LAYRDGRTDDGRSRALRQEIMKLDQGMHRMLRDFGRALSEAISESSEASEKLREIRDRGYSLYLLLDGARSERLTADTPSSDAPKPRAPRAPRRPRPAEPEFRINGDDLSFLRSVGIDPTRRLRGRRG
jgi:hypothetical protein